MYVLHHDDLDGQCAAAVVRKAFLDIPTVFRACNYGDDLAGVVRNIVPLATVYIVDFSLPPQVMEILLKKTPHVVWIDHHKTAKDLPYQHLQGLRSFEEAGPSGCELAWSYLFGASGAQPPEAVRLVGDYDTWKHRMPGVLEFFEGMKIEDTSPSSKLWEILLEWGPQSQTKVKRIMEQGEICNRYRDQLCYHHMNAFGYEAWWEGYRVFVGNIRGFGSWAFGDRTSIYPICVGMIWNGEKWEISLYSKTVDVSVLAKKHGGGGHKGAAGFTCPNLDASGLVYKIRPDKLDWANIQEEKTDGTAQAESSISTVGLVWD